jgi:hypothetical protein
MNANKYLNIPIIESGGNTGNPDYVFRPGLIKGAILTSKSKKFTPAEMATFLEILQDATLASGKDRIYPIFEFKEIADKSTEATKNTSGYGFNEIVREGKVDWVFTMGATFGVYNSKQLRKLNSGSWRAIFVDENNNLIFTHDEDGNVMGADLEYFHQHIWKVNEGTKPSVFTAEFALNEAKELNDNVAIYKPDFDVKDSIKGLINLELKIVSQAAGKVTLQVVTECDQVNLYDELSTELAVATLWKPINVATGLPVAPTTVAKAAASLGFEVTIPVGTYKISLGTPSALSTAGIGGAPDSGFECLPLVVTIT